MYNQNKKIMITPKLNIYADTVVSSSPVPMKFSDPFLMDLEKYANHIGAVKDNGKFNKSGIIKRLAEEGLTEFIIQQSSAK